MDNLPTPDPEINRPNQTLIDRYGLKELQIKLDRVRVPIPSPSRQTRTTEQRLRVKSKSKEKIKDSSKSRLKGKQKVSHSVNRRFRSSRGNTKSKAKSGAKRSRARYKRTNKTGKRKIPVSLLWPTSDEESEEEFVPRRSSRNRDKKATPSSRLPSKSPSSEFNSEYDEYPDPLDRDLAIQSRPRLEKWGYTVNKVTGKAGIRPSTIEEAPPGASINPIRQKIIDALKQAKVDNNKTYEEGVDCVPYKVHKKGVKKIGRDQNLAFKCIHCDEYFGRRYTYRRHLERALQPQDVPCTDPDCEWVFNNIQDMTRHYRIHQNVDKKVRFECRTCGRTFANGFGVLNHMQPRNPNGICPFRHYRRISPEGTKTYGGKREHSPNSDVEAIAQVKQKRQEKAYLRAERDELKKLIKDEKEATRRKKI